MPFVYIVIVLSGAILLCILGSTMERIWTHTTKHAKYLMSSRKDIIREYKERKKPSGIFQVKNTVNGKVFIGGSLNLDGVLNGQKFRLFTGSHRNSALQADWKTFGEAAFEFEILEIIKESDDPNFDLKDELTLLEQIWLEKLEPYGDRGYNIPGEKIRQV